MTERQPIHSFQEAVDFWKGRKNKDKATRLNEYETRILPVESISPIGEITRGMAVQVHATYVVTYLEDGCVVLDHGNWKTKLTTERINTYAPVFVPTILRYNNELWFNDILDYTPARKTTCRTCSGTGLRMVAPSISTLATQCHRCGATGVADYGSKPIRREFPRKTLVKCNADGVFFVANSLRIVNYYDWISPLSNRTLVVRQLDKIMQRHKGQK